MVIFLLITLFPFYWMLRTALSSNNALATDPASLLPVGLNTGGFERVFGLQDVETAISQGGSGASVNFFLASARSPLISANSPRLCSATAQPISQSSSRCGGLICPATSIAFCAHV